ncbi:MAG: 3-hydroxyacyl-CoA dehydrogenase [Chlamydiales bacterium]|jgi:3-hydroxyacyl-CoA dehydrogenase
MEQLEVKKVAILGAGVMGAQIGAHFANVGIEPILFDLSAENGDPNSLVKKSIKGLTKLQPPPFATGDIHNKLQAANYSNDLANLGDCDLVIEAISERLDWKVDLYKKIAPYMKKNAILATNTSGISIADLAKAMPESQASRFLGMHFFNPPRYMKLVELVPHKNTDNRLLDQMESFLVGIVGKGVVKAKDTPNFIGNRIGVFSMLSAIHHAEKFGLAPDAVDAITGPLIGRPKSATFRTLDVVGLDTFSHVVNTIQVGLPDDPWVDCLKVPAWITGLIEKGALGAKVKAGVFKKVGREIQVIDLKEKAYRPVNSELNPEILKILKTPDVSERFEKLKNSDLPEAKFLFACFCDMFHYCAYHFKDIAHSKRDVDLALRWGYGWTFGPFETWSAIGWEKVITWLKEAIDAGHLMSNVALPEWVYEVSAGNLENSSSSLPVYKHQFFPDTVLGEKVDEGKTVFETDYIRLWTLDGEAAIASFKSKGNTISRGVIEGIQLSLQRAEKEFNSLIIWQRHGDFCLGADLNEFMLAVKDGTPREVTQFIQDFQNSLMALKYARIPTIAAVNGRSLGGGCEVIMHCARTVAALESYMGLVEVGVGVIPAGGGTKEMAVRASEEASTTGNLEKAIQRLYQNLAMAQVSASGLDAKLKGFLKSTDVVVNNPNEVLYVAHSQAKAMVESNYLPPIPQRLQVLGRSGIATLQTQLANMREGGFISAHDYRIGTLLAKVICGGDIESGQKVNEAWLLRLEVEAFVELLYTKETQERILFTLKNGKPLRN